jgi:hypothetical protein
MPRRFRPMRKFVCRSTLDRVDYSVKLALAQNRKKEAEEKQEEKKEDKKGGK